MERHSSRRSFLTTAGAAAGAAMIGVSPAVAAPRPEPVSEPTELQPEPLVVIVRDRRKDEITLLVGKRESTYRDPELVRRLLGAAASSAAGQGGVA